MTEDTSKPTTPIEILDRMERSLVEHPEALQHFSYGTGRRFNLDHPCRSPACAIGRLWIAAGEYKVIDSSGEDLVRVLAAGICRWAVLDKNPALRRAYDALEAEAKRVLGRKPGWDSYLEALYEDGPKRGEGHEAQVEQILGLVRAARKKLAADTLRPTLPEVPVDERERERAHAGPREVTV